MISPPPSGGMSEHTLPIFIIWSRRGLQSSVPAANPVQGKNTSYAGAKDSVALDAQYPAFREEMVCSLLETLINHPRAVAASKLSPAHAEAQRSGQQDGALADAVQALSLQQAPPANPGGAVFSSAILHCPLWKASACVYFGHCAKPDSACSCRQCMG